VKKWAERILLILAGTFAGCLGIESLMRLAGIEYPNFIRDRLSDLFSAG
jgi:hypothetical protein